MESVRLFGRIELVTMSGLQSHISQPIEKRHFTQLDWRRRFVGIQHGCKIMRNHPRGIHYAQSNPAAHGQQDMEELMKWRIIAFADAGFGPPTQNHSVEGNFLVSGHVVSRGGVVYFHGGLLDRRGAKIHRV